MPKRGAVGEQIARLHRETTGAAIDIKPGWKKDRLFGRNMSETVVKLARRADHAALATFSAARSVAEAYLWIDAGAGADRPPRASVDRALRRHGASFVALHRLCNSIKVPVVLYLRIHALRCGGKLPVPPYLPTNSAVDDFSNYVGSDASADYAEVADLSEYLWELTHGMDFGRDGVDNAREFRTRFMIGQSIVERLIHATGMPRDLVVALEMESLPVEFLAADAAGAKLVSQGVGPRRVLAAVNDFALRVEIGPTALREAFGWAVKQ